MAESQSTTTQTRAFNRAEKIVNNWVKDRILSQSGKDWLVASLDPFHDTELKTLQGWPDVETGYSVVRKVKQQLVLQSPVGAPFGANWDCYIDMGALLENRAFNVTTTRTNNTFNATNAGTGTYGGCAAWAVVAGTTWSPFTGSPNTVAIGALSANAPFTTGVGRCIGIGFEVTNTTAPLYRQGSCTVFKMMQSPKDPITLYGFQPALQNCIQSYTLLRFPPPALSNLTLLPGSQTWNAEEGCYVVGHFHTNENPPFQADFNLPGFSSTDPTANVVNNVSLILPLTVVGAVAGSATSHPSHVHPLHTSGAYFAGLSTQTTLNLVLTYYYETFPNESESEVLVLATPSAEFDPVALEIYSHALSLMPPGVKYGENPKGEWWANVIEKVSNFISYIPHPLAQVAAKGGQTLAQMIRENSRQKGTALATTSDGKLVEYTPSAGFAMTGRPIMAIKNGGGKKKKRLRNKNLQLQSGNRGKKGNIQGPLRS